MISTEPPRISLGKLGQSFNIFLTLGPGSTLFYKRIHTCAERTNRASMECVSKDAFYQKLEALKQNQRRKTSLITLFIEDQFYDSAKEFLKSKAQNIDLNDGKLTKSQATTLHRKKWLYHQGKILTTDQKEVIPKSQLYDILTLAHQRTAQRGRQKKKSLYLSVNVFSAEH